MKIAVTGPRGFIAKNLVTALKSQGHEIVTIDRGILGESLQRWFAQEKPEAVIHLATLFLKMHSYGDIPKLMESNLTLTTELLENCVMNGVRQFVGFGTYYQFPVPATLYAATKSAQEPLFDFYVTQKKLPITVLYLYDTYGPGDLREKILNLLLKAAKTGEELQLSPGEQNLKLLHVNDVCAAILATLTLPGSPEPTPLRFAVEPGESPMLKELALRVEHVTGKKIKAKWGARPYPPGVRMKPELPYPPLPGFQAQKTLEEGLVEMAKS